MNIFSVEKILDKKLADYQRQSNMKCIEKGRTISNFKMCCTRFYLFLTND